MQQSRNPDTIHPPVGRYVHQIEVDAPSKVLFISGQVGMRPDGSIPDDPAEQLGVCLENIVRNLEAAGLDRSDLVKITTYAVAELDPTRRRLEIDRVLGDRLTTSTLVYVAALAAPQYKVEVEAWAAR